ncbi:nuclear pore complex protein Nup153 isoform X2 [Lampetra planeri]
MATAGGGGKIRSKRQHGAGKPYARNKGLLGRVTDNVKNLIPSWLQSYFRTDDSTAAGAAPPTSSAPSRSPSSSLDSEEARPAPLDGFSFAGLNHDAQQNCEVAGDGAKPSTSTAATSGYTYTVPFPRTRGPQKRQPIDRSHATQHGSLALQSWLPAAGNAAGPKPGDARDVAATGREAGVGSGSASAVVTGTRSGQTMPVLSGADGVARDVRDSSSQCEDDSVSTTSGFSSRASDKGTATATPLDVSMQPRVSAVLLQPLWCMGAELPARSTPQPSAHSAKKPSFNLTVFDSSRTAGGLGSGQRGESTFYAGKTTYGGASAMSRPSQRKLPAAPYQAPYRVQVKAKPATPRLTSAVTSVTARRILQSLEKLSSPLSDALKIPSSNTSPSLSGSSYLDPVSSLRAHRLQPQRPPVQQLVTPRAAVVSSSRSLYRRSWAGPSRTASPSPSTTTTTAAAQSSLASDSTQPGTSCDNRTLQSSKASLPGPPKALAELATPVANGLPRGGGGGGGGGKMKRERIAVHFSAQKDDESESDVTLPSVPLPIRAGALPSFSFGPVATSTPANTRSAALAAAAAIGSSTGAGGGGGSDSTDKMPFAFTTPPVKATEIEQPPTSQPPPFQFSTPVTKAGLVTTPTTLPSSGTGFAFRLPSATQTTPVPSVSVVAAGAATLSGHKERSGGTTSPAGDLKGSKGMSKRSNDEDNDSGGGPFKAAKTLKSGSVLDILMASSAPKGPGLGEAAASGGSGGEVRPTASGFGDRFRPPEGSWECNACMVQNQASHVTCVACQASKPTPKRATAPSSIPAANAKPPQAAGPSLAEQFAAPPGSWDCDTCMVSNRGETSRCVACDTPRAGLAPKRSALAPPLSTSSSSSAASTFFSSGVSTAPASITRAPASSAPPPAYTKPSAAAAGASSLASLFVRPEGAWDCDVCMVQNKAGSGSCAACQTAKPGGKAPMSSAAPAATPVGFGDKFKRPAGSWDCDTCMVSNSASTNVCACCSTERPGAARPTAQAPAQPDRPTFSFGLSSDDSAASALPSAAATFSFNSQGGFKFGTGSTSASKDTTTTAPSSTAGASGVTDTSGPAAAARGFTFGTTAPANDSTVTFGGGFKLPSSDAAETAQTSAATFTFGTKVGAGNSTVSAAATTDSSAAAASTAKIAEPKGPSGGTFQFGVATPSFGQNALAGGADASKLGAGFAFASDKEAAPATFGGFQFKTSGAAEQPAATATFGAFGGVKRSDGAGPEGKAVPPLATGFSFSKEAAQKTDADEPTAKKPFGFATMNPSAAATPGLFGAAAPAPASSAAAPVSGSSFSFGTKPIAFGVPVKPDAPAANAGPSTSIGAAPPFMFGPAASVSAAKPDPAATGAAPACSSAQIAPFGFAPSAKLDKPTTTFLFGPGHESQQQQQQLAGTAANNSATPVAPFVFGKTDAGVTNATATNAAAAPPVFGAVPKTDAPAANSGVAGAPGSGGSTFMFGPSAGSAASAATAAVTPFGFGGVTGAASSSGAGFGSGSSSIFSAPGSSLPTFGTASSAPPAGAAHAFGTQPGSSGGGDGGGGPGGAPFRQQPPTQPPAFGSSGPSQLAPPAFGFSANQQQAPAFGSGAAPAGGQQPLFSAAVQKPAFGPGGAAGQPAGSGSFQFSGAAPAAAAAQGFNFGAASSAPGPSGSSLTFGGSPQQAPGTFQFNARPGFNIGMSGSPANQFQGSSSATLKNRKYKTAVRRRK